MLNSIRIYFLFYDDAALARNQHFSDDVKMTRLIVMNCLCFSFSLFILKPCKTEIGLTISIFHIHRQWNDFCSHKHFLNLSLNNAWDSVPNILYGWTIWGVALFSRNFSIVAIHKLSTWEEFYGKHRFHWFWKRCHFTHTPSYIHTYEYSFQELMRWFGHHIEWYSIASYLESVVCWRFITKKTNYLWRKNNISMPFQWKRTASPFVHNTKFNTESSKQPKADK